MPHQGANTRLVRQFDCGEGCCLFNDQDWAALEFKKLGLKPLYIDWDVNAGDGRPLRQSSKGIPWNRNGKSCFVKLTRCFSKKKSKRSLGGVFTFVLLQFYDNSVQLFDILFVNSETASVVVGLTSVLRAGSVNSKPVIVLDHTLLQKLDEITVTDIL